MLSRLLAALHKRESGSRGESQALLFLQAQGLHLITRNFRSRFGEIDLIMQDKQTLVFVEVRVRRHSGYGSAAESVTAAKQQKLLRTAQVFLQQHPDWQKHTCRFDIVGFHADGDTTTTKTHVPAQWLRAAFTL